MLRKHLTFKICLQHLQRFLELYSGQNHFFGTWNFSVNHEIFPGKLSNYWSPKPL